MIRSEGSTEKFGGSAPSISPTAQEKGVFSLCSGGIPQGGGFARLPGKVLKALSELGGIINIMEFGKQVAVQFYAGLAVYEATEIFPNPADYVYDNDGILVVDNFGFPITT